MTFSLTLLSWFVPEEGKKLLMDFSEMFIHRILPIIVDKPECVLTFRACNQPIERREGDSPLPIRGYREGGTFPKQFRPLPPFLQPVFQGQRTSTWMGHDGALREAVKSSTFPPARPHCRRIIRLLRIAESGWSGMAGP